MTQRDPGCLPAPQGASRRALDGPTKARIDRLLAVLRSRLERAAVEGRTGEIHLVVELRQGQPTVDSHMTGPREYPLRG